MKKFLTILVLLTSLLGWSQVGEPTIAMGGSMCPCLNGCGDSFRCDSEGSLGDCSKTPLIVYKNGRRKKGTHVLVNSVGYPTPPDPDILYIEYPDGHIEYPNGGRADVVISPIPVRASFSVFLEMTDFVTANNVQITDYKIIDHNGAVMREENVLPCQSLDINVDYLTSGNYFIHFHLDQPLENGSNEQTKQFIKE